MTLQKTVRHTSTEVGELHVVVPQVSSSHWFKNLRKNNLERFSEKLEFV
jgi:hypothetical protein